MQEECLSQCKDDPECAWFALDPNQAACFFLKSCPSLDTSCQNCISGENDCQINVEGMRSFLFRPGTSILFIQAKIKDSPKKFRLYTSLSFTY